MFRAARLSKTLSARQVEAHQLTDIHTAALPRGGAGKGVKPAISIHWWLCPNLIGHIRWSKIETVARRLKVGKNLSNLITPAHFTALNGRLFDLEKLCVQQCMQSIHCGSACQQTRARQRQLAPVRDRVEVRNGRYRRGNWCTESGLSSDLGSK